MNSPSFKMRYLTCVVPALFIGACNSSSSTSGGNNTPPTVPCNPCIIFVSESTHNGNFASIPNAESGFNGADIFCNQDNNKPPSPSNATYKALLFGNNSTRIGIRYVRTDGTTTITESATGGNLNGNPSTLLNSIIEPTKGVKNVWTGPNIHTCSSWTSDSAPITNCNDTPSACGATGAPSVSSVNWAYSGTLSCSKSQPLYCVQQ